MKVAGIDIGSNAIRLAIAEGNNVKDLKIINKLRVPLRLGEEAFGPTGSFSRDTIELAIEVFKSFADVIEKEGVEKTRAFATSAFREASNSQELASAVLEKTGIRIERMSGDLEARVVLESITARMDLDSKKDYLLFDLGGGSMELSMIEEGVIAGSRSFELGTVRLMNFMASVSDNEKKIDDLLHTCQHEILGFLDEKILNSQRLKIIGTGGNFRRLLKVRNMIKSDYCPFLVPSDLPMIRSELEKRTYLERIKHFELRPDRADVIIPAVRIIHNVVSVLPVKKIYTPNVGLINGILGSLVKES